MLVACKLEIRYADIDDFLDVGKSMDEGMKDLSEILKNKWEHLGQSPKANTGSTKEIEEFLAKERARLSGGR